MNGAQEKQRRTRSQMKKKKIKELGNDIDIDSGKGVL